MSGPVAVRSDFQDRLNEVLQRSGHIRTVAAHAVNEAMVGMWAEAMLDDNPVYVNPDAAIASGRAGVIAPPTMIQAWSMPSLAVMAQGMRDVPGYRPYWRDGLPARPDNPVGQVFKLLVEEGFATSLATNCHQTYHRELVPGDRVTTITTVDAVSDEKHTAAGVGHFVTTRLEYVDQNDSPVATQLWTVLRFRPPTAEEAAAAAGARRATRPSGPSTEAAAVEPRSRLVGRPRVGQRTESKVIPITATFVIATAFATHDFYAIHHDTDWTRGVGQPDIFTNILTTTALVGGVFTAWAGPSARLRSTDLRLLTPNCPGDELTLTGEVTRVDGDEVTLSVLGVNRKGVHVRAEVVGSVATTDPREENP